MIELYVLSSFCIFCCLIIDDEKLESYRLYEFVDKCIYPTLKFSLSWPLIAVALIIRKIISWLK